MSQDAQGQSQFLPIVSALLLIVPLSPYVCLVWDDKADSHSR